jgi:hypothetical protein
VDGLDSNSWPRIIWVASRPPVPPFSGPISKSLCGIDALSRVTEVEVVTFASTSECVSIADSFAGYWGKNRAVSCRVLNYGPRAGWLQSMITRRFQFGTMIEQSSLASVLTDLDWSSPSRLLLFDDIVLATFTPAYGQNTILSPHDCMSEMFRSHYRLSPVSPKKMRYFIQFLIARHYEQSFYHYALLTHVIADRDRIWLEGINPRARYHVVPNADLLNPGFTSTEQADWDIMIWGDLGIGSIARGAKEFLMTAAQDSEWLANTKILVVGRVPESQAQTVLGKRLLARVQYSVRLENTRGILQQAKITVVPDVGGAGIKNRCVNLLSSGRCLACLYQQMEGIEKAWDRGAINAVAIPELVKRVRAVLSKGTYRRIADTGREIYEQEYSTASIQNQWVQMVRRAVAVRNGLIEAADFG